MALDLDSLGGRHDGRRLAKIRRSGTCPAVYPSVSTELYSCAVAATGMKMCHRSRFGDASLNASLRRLDRRSFPTLHNAQEARLSQTGSRTWSEACWFFPSNTQPERVRGTPKREYILLPIANASLIRRFGAPPGAAIDDRCGADSTALQPPLGRNDMHHIDHRRSTP